MTLLDKSLRVSALVCVFSSMVVRGQAPAAGPQPSRLAAGVIESIDFTGASGVPEATLKALIPSKAGDTFDGATIRSDFTALWNTGRFDDIRVNTERGERGGTIVHFDLIERGVRALPELASNVIEGIEFRGLNLVQEETLRAAILSKAGDVYDEITMRGSFTALWNTKRFDDIRLSTYKGARGGMIVRFAVTERP